jgi:hypothetical protein
MKKLARKGEFQSFLYRPYSRAFAHLAKDAQSSADAQRALEQVMSIHEALKSGDQPAVPITKHGESRIAHVIKYDLAGFHRLVLWRHGGLQVPLYVGSHASVERWLNQYAGADFAFTVDGTGRIQDAQYRKVRSSSDAVEQLAQAADVQDACHTEACPLALLPIDLLVQVGLSLADARELCEGLRRDLPEPARKRLVGTYLPNDEERQFSVLTAYEHARQGLLESAIMDLRLASGLAQCASDTEDTFADALTNSKSCANVAQLDEHALTLLHHQVGSYGVDDWMLFLHPSQQQIVQMETTGPTRLLGVSGSGKTAVLLHRAVALSRRYPTERILVATLNEALSKYLAHLLDRLCAGDPCRRRIHVRSLRDLFSDVARTRHRGAIRGHDPVSGETPEESWVDFTAKNAARLEKIASAIAQDKRAEGCTPSSYIYEELIWIRSGWGTIERSHYDIADRVGRVIPFPKCLAGLAQEVRSSFPPETRPTLRHILSDFEEYMSFGEVYDLDAISVLAHTAKTRSNTPPQAVKYRCVLVDEMQDMSTLELEVLNWVSPGEHDGLFLCGDLAQKVFPKHHDPGMAGLSFKGRGLRLEQNFRNTREILVAAHALVEQFGKDAAVEQSEILDPKFAVRRGERPHLIECASREQQSQYAFDIVSQLLNADLERSSTCVVSHDDNTLQALETMFSKAGIPALRLSPRTKFDDDRFCVRLAHLEDVKGFEFKNVLLLDVSDPNRSRHDGPGGGILREGYPTRGVPFGERWRDAFKLYVAMSRARDVLHICYVYNRSRLLGSLGDRVFEDHAANWLSTPEQVAAANTDNVARLPKPARVIRRVTAPKAAMPKEHAVPSGFGSDFTDSFGDCVVWGGR